MSYRILEINGGQVQTGPDWSLSLAPKTKGYSDAQFDDYGGLKRSEFCWRPGTKLSLEARFSHRVRELVGTAGFGFWNAPFGDPTMPWPALPQATWFFYASEPSDLPFAPSGPGRGWFAATLDASTSEALSMVPLTPVLVVLNNIPLLRRIFWPQIRKRLAIDFVQIECSLTDWHLYQLDWRDDGCEFAVDGQQILNTRFTPKGPLGFVCWMDNQRMVAKPTGRFRWGDLSLIRGQWLEARKLLLTGGNT